MSFNVERLHSIRLAGEVGYIKVFCNGQDWETIPLEALPETIGYVESEEYPEDMEDSDSIMFAIGIHGTHTLILTHFEAERMDELYPLYDWYYFEQEDYLWEFAVDNEGDIKMRFEILANAVSTKEQFYSMAQKLVFNDCLKLKVLNDLPDN